MTLDEAIKRAEEVAEMKKALSEESELQGCSMYAIRCGKSAEEHRQLAGWLKELKQLREQTRWIPVSERLPENANHLGALCPRYRISSAKYGVTEGWYNPDRRTWYGLIWQLTPGNIDMGRGDIPVVIRMIDVTAWMELPAPYKAESEGK